MKKVIQKIFIQLGQIADEFLFTKSERKLKAKIDKFNRFSTYRKVDYNSQLVLRLQARGMSRQQANEFISNNSSNC